MTGYTSMTCSDDKHEACEGDFFTRSSELPHECECPCRHTHLPADSDDRDPSGLIRPNVHPNPEEKS